MTTELETKPDAESPGQAALAAAAKPDGAAPEANGQPPANGSEPSNVVPKEQYEASVRAMNEAQRRAAEAEARASLYERMTQAAAGVQPANDPLAAAEQEWEANPYDPAAAKKVMSLREERLRQQMRNELLFTQRQLQSLPRAQEILGVDNVEQAAQLLNEELQRPKTLEEAALLRKHREGKLAEWVAEDQKAREMRAKHAALSGPNGMVPGGRSVPGSPGSTRKVVIPWQEWAAANESTKAAIRKDFDNPLVEYAFADVPENLKARFDPRRD